MSDRSHTVMLADIGGTHARFALGAGAAAPLRSDSVRHYAVAEFDTFLAAAEHYLDAIGARPRTAVLSVAGPVRAGGVDCTNNAWRIESDATRTALKLTTLRLINDFAAMSRALPLLGARQVEALDDFGLPAVGAEDDQTFAVIGPGTGLGVGALLRRDGGVLALQTEGGHVSFAPTTALQVEILALMHRRIGHVYNESLISGHGLLALYQTLAEIEAVDAPLTTPEQITAAAHDGDDGLCVRTLETFSAIFGAIAGDAALMFGAWQGVFLSGGLAPVMLPWLRRGAVFRQHFEDKDNRRDVLEGLPIAVITDGDAGLYGAAAVALDAADGN